MAFKLTKAQSTDYAALLSGAAEAHEALSSAVDGVNNAIQAAWEEVSEKLEAFNQARTDLKEFASDIAECADSEYSDKSEKWQEGERGQAARSWIDTWASADLDPIEMDIPGPVELDTEAPEELPGAAE